MATSDSVRKLRPEHDQKAITSNMTQIIENPGILSHPSMAVFRSDIDLVAMAQGFAHDMIYELARLATVNADMTENVDQAISAVKQAYDGDEPIDLEPPLLERNKTSQAFSLARYWFDTAAQGVGIKDHQN